METMAGSRRRAFALLPERVRAIRPPKWWQEIAFIAIVYYLYSLVRNAAPSHEVGAMHRAEWLLGFERTLRIDIEQSANTFVANHPWLAYFCDYYYATLHFVVTIGVLVWLYRRHPLRYRSIRSVLMIMNVVALLGFWFISLAPPRMMAGFTDTLIKFHTWGSIASGSLAKESNQFAAMPSLHVGWALWCAIAIVMLAERRWVRVLGAAYPLLTIYVIIGTANHFVLDAVGGAIVLCLAIVIERLLSGRHAYSHAAFAAHLTPEPELAAA